MVARWDPRLTLAEFAYIANHHPLSTELQFAVAVALFVCLERGQIAEFLREFHGKFDRLFSFLAIFCGVTGFLVPVYEWQYVNHCDCVFVAVVLTDCYVRGGEPERCDCFLRLLINSVERLPEAGLALAKYFVAKERFGDAVVALNAACHSVGWPVTTRVRNGTGTGEEWLMSHPLAGTEFEMVLILARLAATVGPAEFPRLFRGLARPGGRLPMREVPEGPRGIPDEAGELSFLFDPGVDGVVSLGRLAALPLSDRLRRAIVHVQDTLERKERCKREPEIPIAIQIILSVRVGDSEFLNSLLAPQRRAGLSGFEKTLLIRAAMLGMGMPMEEVLLLPSKFETQTQHAAFRLVQVLASAWVRHRQEALEENAGA
jgi:hypothetical protein